MYGCYIILRADEYRQPRDQRIRRIAFANILLFPESANIKAPRNKRGAKLASVLHGMSLPKKKVGPARARTFAQRLISPQNRVLPDRCKGNAFS